MPACSRPVPGMNASEMVQFAVRFNEKIVRKCRTGIGSLEQNTLSVVKAELSKNNCKKLLNKLGNREQYLDPKIIKFYFSV